MYYTTRYIYYNIFSLLSFSELFFFSLFGFLWLLFSWIILIRVGRLSCICVLYRKGIRRKGVYVSLKISDLSTEHFYLLHVSRSRELKLNCWSNACTMYRCTFEIDFLAKFRWNSYQIDLLFGKYYLPLCTYDFLFCTYKVNLRVRTEEKITVQKIKSRSRMIILLILKCPCNIGLQRFSLLLKH